MTFFQNPFTQEFRGNLVLGDRQHSPTYICPRNAGRGDELVIGWENGPFDLSGTDLDGDNTNTLVIKHSQAATNFKGWATLEIDITSEAASSSNVTVYEIVASLNAVNEFTAWFTASVENGKVLIRQKKPSTQFRFYIVNGKAEEVLRFNARAGVAELPSYFARHTVGNAFDFEDSQNLLVSLDTGLNVDSNVIDNAVNEKGVPLELDSSSASPDYSLLKGRSGIFTFQKITVDASDRITQIIEYPAGAEAGDLGRKIIYVYTSTNTKPDQITEEPYVLESGDLVTP